MSFGTSKNKDNWSFVFFIIAFLFLIFLAIFSFSHTEKKEKEHKVRCFSSASVIYQDTLKNIKIDITGISGWDSQGYVHLPLSCIVQGLEEIFIETKNDNK